MRRILVILGVILFLIVMPFAPQVPGWFVVNMPKTGRVVDRETGKGLPNAFVLANATYYEGPVVLAGPSTSGMLYRVITRTDSRGYFAIPNTWSRLFVATPWAEWHVNWVVTVFEPGYIVEGDERSFELLEKDGWPRYNPRSTGASPDIVGISGLSLRIEDIHLYRKEMTLGQAAWYYERIISVSHPKSLSMENEDFAIKARAFEFFTPWVCGIPPEEEINGTTASSLLRIVNNIISSRSILKRFNKNIISTDDYRKLRFLSGDICAAMTNEATKP